MYTVLINNRKVDAARQREGAPAKPAKNQKMTWDEENEEVLRQLRRKNRKLVFIRASLDRPYSSSVADQV